MVVFLGGSEWGFFKEEVYARQVCVGACQKDIERL